MNGKGVIVAYDIEPLKLKQLHKRMLRSGATNISIIASEDKSISTAYHQKADCILIDAPCNGLGTLGRNPDLKWRMNLEAIHSIEKTQQNLLQKYSQTVKPGGVLVYATCTFLPNENQTQIALFLNSKKGADFSLEKAETFFKSETGFDSFFIAKLKRRDSN